MRPETGNTPSVTWRDVPKSVWALGFVSLLMDVSSELIHSLLPVFLVTVIGTSMAVVGLIEGVAEATAAITKVFSGALSDRIGKRKLLVGIGYGLAAVTKPVFPLASTAWEVLAARFVDHLVVGKGIRDAPRDALVADITPPADALAQDASYGIRQALDTVGGFAGPLLAMALMALYAERLSARCSGGRWLPAALAALLIVVGVREPDGDPGDGEARLAASARRNSSACSPAFWVVVCESAWCSRWRASARPFLVLKAQAEGLALALYPAGVRMDEPRSTLLRRRPRPAVLSDRIGQGECRCLCGLGALVVADLARFNFCKPE